MLESPSRRPRSYRLIQALVAMGLSVASWPAAMAQDPPPGPWIRLDPLPAELRLTSRESFDGVPPRFVLMTDGSVYVGGRREMLRGSLDKKEMQEISTALDQAVKSLGKAGPPQTLVAGEGPAIFRFSVLLGKSFQTVVMGTLENVPASSTSARLATFIRGVAGFRHPSLRPFDPPQFAMIVRERTLTGGCRTAPNLPPLSQSLTRETLVSATSTQGFPTGPEMTQVCQGSRRFTVVFRPLFPGER